MYEIYHIEKSGYINASWADVNVFVVFYDGNFNGIIFFMLLSWISKTIEAGYSTLNLRKHWSRHYYSLEIGCFFRSDSEPTSKS
ncbi:MAG TPA: hypothetical protein VKB19_01450, partial [Pedobacter sp.]|nr:hypothetical protein [Pedobacter sp.]